MSRQLSSKTEHRYLPPERVGELKCEYCDHYSAPDRRCMLIRREAGPVNPGDCCARWNNTAILAEVYGVETLGRRPLMRPPDLGRLYTKAEVNFVEDVDASVQGCRDCQFFSAPGTCALIGEGTVEPDGASAWWRNVQKEAMDDRFHAEFKSPPPEADRPWVERVSAWVFRSLGEGTAW